MSSIISMIDSLSNQSLPEPNIQRFDGLAHELENCQMRAEMLRSSLGLFLEEELAQKIEKYNTKVFSIDVFDTLLLRNSKPEALRYHEISQITLKYLSNKLPHDRRVSALTTEDVLESRIFGIKETYRTRSLVDGCGEGIIDEIVRGQLLFLNLDPELSSDIIALEVDYECENLEVNPLLLSLSKHLKEDGTRIILISDMYLPAKLIALIIKKMLNSSPFDQIFSSADTIVSKRSGKLFFSIAKKLEVEPEHFFHVGDSWLADVVRAREAGWRAQYFPVSTQERRERTMKLNEFSASMRQNGYDVGDWAKL